MVVAPCSPPECCGSGGWWMWLVRLVVVKWWLWLVDVVSDFGSGNMVVGGGNVMMW